MSRRKRQTVKRLAYCGFYLEDEIELLSKGEIMRIEEFGKRSENGPASREFDSGEKEKKTNELDTSSRVPNEIGSDYLKQKNVETSKNNWETDPHNTERTSEKETKPDGNSPFDDF